LRASLPAHIILRNGGAHESGDAARIYHMMLRARAVHHRVARLCAANNFAITAYGRIALARTRRLRIARVRCAAPSLS